MEPFPILSPIYKLLLLIGCFNRSLKNRALFYVHHQTSKIQGSIGDLTCARKVKMGFDSDVVLEIGLLENDLDIPGCAWNWYLYFN
ncbi:hypothetical protein HanXRQr2_Chr10g0424311 [Helianthus annuus]|uniref:Uncharacterized protein n=1 Tax=Helianthus annuus TaxID=4232 RepID=A0A251TFS6_HELAN|nr:hypothetical protein HanXRQr2_Chr10g0424311 [Helianthus annuus]KAJ0520278.1 hypothetical protein HanIR_Chr10g0457591 [Helianthus annuus]